MATPFQRRLEVVRAWVESARDDRTAVELLERSAGPLRVVAFHSQQAVEKLLKAPVVSYGIDPDDSHDIGRLVGQLHKLDRGTASALGAVERLTTYAVVTRYPPRRGGMPKSLDAATVSSDVDVAKRACATIDAALTVRASALAAESPST